MYTKQCPWEQNPNCESYKPAATYTSSNRRKDSRGTLSLNLVQFVLYQVMSYKAETLLPEKKGHRPGLKGTENSHMNVHAALKTPGTFYKHTHKIQEEVGPWRTGKSFASETTEGHQAFKPLPFTLFQSRKQTPHLEPGSPLPLTFYFRCPTYVTEMCTSFSLHKESSSLPETLFVPSNEDLRGPMLIIH